MNQLITRKEDLPVVAKDRNIAPALWNSLKEIFGHASDEMTALAVDYCKARNLDPLKKPIHIVTIYDVEQRKYVERVLE